MLNKLSQIANNPNEEERIKKLAEIIGVQPNLLMHSTDLQKEGKEFLMRQWEKNVKTPYTTTPLLQNSGR